MGPLYSQHRILPDSHRWSVSVCWINESGKWGTEAKVLKCAEGRDNCGARVVRSFLERGELVRLWEWVRWVVSKQIKGDSKEKESWAKVWESNKHGIVGHSRENRNVVAIMGNEIRGVVNPNCRDSRNQATNEPGLGLSSYWFSAPTTLCLLTMMSFEAF